MTGGYTLIGRNASPYTRRVAVTLRLLDQPFEQIKLAPSRDAEAVRAYNPAGRVPVLLLPDGERLTDSGFIIDYLLETHDLWGRLLAPRGPRRRRALQRLALVLTAQEKAAYAVRASRQRPPGSEASPFETALRSQARTAFGLLDESLADLPAPEGEAELSQDAIAAAIATSFARAADPLLLEGLSLPRLEALTARLEAMPAFLAQPLEAP
ncbi:Glutathione S-transferase [Tistlia consotensis]|uniref:Glutathione S-transferase n=1 Tax=Tistlia consotensis USBA 355 TaxID=560819 RepID=A0A1Y6C0R6_9PROT|nr:glutathione S-transferase family protein [Tistlia consotensis]SMF30473.1 Glutathione S-transferase [Tistlia consotensis USBA 355]SNR89974.1 Glutathione S-transferase [Tistlia consotensis]